MILIVFFVLLFSRNPSLFMFYLFFQDFQLEKRLDNKLIEQAKQVINGKQKSVKISLMINNECRAFGSTLSYEIAW